MLITIKRIDGEYWLLSDNPAFVSEWGNAFKCGRDEEILVVNMRYLTKWAQRLDTACMFEMEV